MASLSGVKLGGDTGIFSKVAVNGTLDNEATLVSYSSGSGGNNRINGIKGVSDYWNGVLGVATAQGTGVAGSSNFGMGVYGTASDNFGTGVKGENFRLNGKGVWGKSPTGWGVFGESGGDAGVRGDGVLCGVEGVSKNGIGIHGQSDHGYAGSFDGNVKITGTLTKGSGTFKIDHPQDPANKYLSHSFVESPDMKNVYDGTILLDDSGEATVNLPSYFEALNRDFRYQLTCIGAYAPVYVAEKVKDNNFKIAGGKAGMEVSWQVTGIRQDPFANAHPVVVEEEKPANEKGLYLHPVEYGQPKEKGIDQLPKP